MTPPRDITRPQVDTDRAARIAEAMFGVVGVASELPSERDRNFLVEVPDGPARVLKVSHPGTGIATVRRETELMQIAGALAGVIAPASLPTTDGAGEGAVDIEGVRHIVRLLSFVPGRALATLRPRPLSALRRIGEAAGRLVGAFDGVASTPDDDVFAWDLRTARSTVHDSAVSIADPVRRDLVTRLVEIAAERVAAAGPLETGLIHGDLNDNNVLVGDDIGVIDFGDAHRSHRAAEVAIAAAYACFGFVDPVEAIGAVVAGANDVVDLTVAEVSVVTDLVVLRLGLSVVFGGLQVDANPGNPYLAVSQQDAWDTLERLAEVPPRLASRRVLAAAGMADPGPVSTFQRWARRHRDDLAPVLGVPMAAGRALLIDWSVTSADTCHPAVAPAVATLSRDVFRRLDDAGASFGVGRYGEPRLVYAAPEFAVPTNRGPAARTVHLGVDLTAPPGTPVHALWAGTVERVDDEALEGAYGPVVTIRHRPADGPAFSTLSGHLAVRTADDVVVGDTVAAGAVIGTIGEAPGNGGWSPHVHFQVILDLLDIDGPFPGVALPDQWEVWAALCPSPATALGLPAALVDAPHPDDEKVVDGRRTLLPASLSTSYREPVVAVRGFSTHLYDGWGRAYLDCVNNVAHVGHEHPHVVDALIDQARLLNTNSRYPHPERVRYVERLGALFPDPLDTVFLVCTGSEANDLALRMATTVTGRRNIVVLDGAYHGTTTALIDASPHKHGGPGGSGRPAHVRIVPTPDPYRSAGGGDVDWHLRHIDEAIADVEPAAFIAESLMGVAGQIEPPCGYLSGVYERIRRTGGLCIADEVQVGFGRVGSHFWGFERQGVVPDIVTLGKPMGNGHPLAAVVTTRAVADAFANGMEYFNTFGGNPVSCAVGNAVLDVLDSERLQRHAARTGAGLMAELRLLATSTPLIGDVRGRGLFIGVELVNDRATKDPARAQARYIVERARHMGVLLSVDGPLDNVLKIKPPMPFSAADSDRLVSLLADLVAEDGARPGHSAPGRS